MYIKLNYYAIILLLIVSCTTTTPDLKDDTVFDYKLYQGKWYEIARLPNPVEDGLVCVTMTYESNDEGIMTVTSRGRNRSDLLDVRTLTGRAWIPDGKEPEKIKIQFIWPVTKDYLLIHMDAEKGYAILGSPLKYHLWILSRTSEIKEVDMADLVQIAEKNQYKIDALVKVEQSCE